MKLGGKNSKKLNSLVALLALVCMMTSMLTACQKSGSLASRLSTTRSTFDNPVSGTGGQAYTGFREPITENVAVDDKSLSEQERDNQRQEAGIDEATLTSVIAAQRGKYYYDTMDENYHKLYAEILIIINNHAENVVVSANDSDVLQYTFLCVYADHPEIFWIDGYNYTRHTKNGQLSYITFGGKYIYTIDECKRYEYRIANYLSAFSSGISSRASDYEKVRYTYEYVIKHTDYVLDSKDNQTIISVFIHGKSVCQGYAKAVQYLLDSLGVQSTVVVGSNANGIGHAWNLVNIDNAYYYLDATWGDDSYNGDGSANASGLAEAINYDYLNITTTELERTHKIDCVVPMPMCVATEANYYVKEGLYFTSYDYRALSEAFDNAYSRGDATISFKCSDRAVFDQMSDELFDDQELFALLKGSHPTASYRMSDKNYTYCFWL